MDEPEVNFSHIMNSFARDPTSLGVRIQGIAEQVRDLDPLRAAKPRKAAVKATTPPEGAAGEEAFLHLRQRRLFRKSVKSLNAAVHEADCSTSSHHDATAQLCFHLARKLGFSRRDRMTLYVAAYIHDVGKLAVPPSILWAPRKLTDHEYELVKGHVAASVRILQPLARFWPDLVDIVAQHHERLDGSGYPAGLKGDEICKATRVLSIVDCLHSILSPRPYRVARAYETVFSVLRQPGYDQSVVDCLEADPGWLREHFPLAG